MLNENLRTFHKARGVRYEIMQKFAAKISKLLLIIASENMQNSFKKDLLVRDSFDHQQPVQKFTDSDPLE